MARGKLPLNFNFSSFVAFEAKYGKYAMKQAMLSNALTKEPAGILLLKRVWPNTYSVV